MNPLIIYHKSCADGFGAAYAAWEKFGEDAEYFPCQYGEVKGVADLDKLPNVSGRDVYVLDFSFPLSVMESIIDLAKSFTWLDHHKTAFEMWCDSELEAKGERDYYTYSSHGVEVLLDNNRSGAMIAWQYFYPTHNVPWIIEHIDDYDRWQFKLSGTKEINKAIWATAPWDFETWNDWVYRFPVAQRAAMIEVGTALLRDHNSRVEAGVKSGAMPCKISRNGKTFYGMALNCPPNVTSDSGHMLATEGGTYGLLWYMNKDGKVKCSLRSNGDYDVSQIAQMFGGGGHKNAAGFEVEFAELMVMLGLIEIPDCCNGDCDQGRTCPNRG